MEKNCCSIFFVGCNILIFSQVGINTIIPIATLDIISGEKTNSTFIDVINTDACISNSS
ncbi:hypothetical protein B0I22_2563 [Epilithonimonas xixisoli]|uniref:Uncharacterized protein n=1 Tax=Epilithonimonas xixisoli TaxID=1476462 RepID=A0A4R8ICU2_9FLAO|nr:hypothetical protein B0I22_2563 [Epilithonimonas xixisoli]